jgi:hypothetical protein
MGIVAKSRHLTQRVLECAADLEFIVDYEDAAGGGHETTIADGRWKMEGRGG